MTLEGVPVMVLAAGLGTRLRPLTDELPKPAVPVGNVPLVRFTLDAVAGAGGTLAVVNAHHLPDRLEAVLSEQCPPGLSVRVSRETELLGTGGGIRRAGSMLLEDDPELVVVLNSDILFAPDIAGAIATHRRLGAMATMVLRPDPEARRFGAIEIDGAGRVRRMLGRPEAVDDGPLGVHMFTGVHVLSPRAFADLPLDGCIIRHAYRRWVDGGAVVAGHVDETPWRDLGTLRAYLEANADMAAGRLRWSGLPAPTGTSLVDPGAAVAEGARLHESVVGRGARVAAGVELHRVVVWPGAEVRTSLRDAIVTPRTVVDVGSGR